MKALATSLFLCILLFCYQSDSAVAGENLSYEKFLQEVPSEEKNRFREIIVGVMRNDPAFLTPSAHSEFWAILDRWTALDPSATEESNRRFRIYLRSWMGSQLRNYQKLFWEDALWAVTIQRPFKSRQREDMEEKMYASGDLSKFQIKKNEDLIEKIANGEAVSLDGGKLVLDESAIKELLGSIDATVLRVETLFTR